MNFLCLFAETEMSQTIRIAEITAFGEAPSLRDAALAPVAGDEVLVRVRAAALNFADLLKARGTYQEAETPPFVPGLEGAGEVLSAPDGSGLAPGDRVAIRHPGTMAERIAVPVAACLPLPPRMSFEQAAGFQIAYGTSHLALDLRAGLKPGETLAVLGAAGGVGLTAVEIGRAMGARVIGVARGADRLQAVRQAGADEVIDSDDCPDLKAALRAAGGVDVVYDPIGDLPGAAAFGALRRGGRFLVIGFAGGQPANLPLNHALVKNIAIHGFYWAGYASLDPQAMRDSMQALFAMFEDGRLSPVAGATLPLERLAEGFEMLRQRKSIGKIVITL